MGPMSRCFGLHRWRRLKWGGSLAPFADLDARECRRCARFEIYAYGSFRRAKREDFDTVRDAA